MPRYCDNTGKPVEKCICQQHASNRNLVLRDLRRDFEIRAKAYCERPLATGRWYNLKESIQRLAEVEDAE